MCLLVYWIKSGILCADKIQGSTQNPAPKDSDPIPRYFHPLCVRLMCNLCYSNGHINSGMSLTVLLCLSPVFLLNQAKKEKLQQAGNRNFERVFLLTPQQPVSQ